jgi:hypothetical protein
MDSRPTDLNSIRSKLGDSLSQISQLTELTIDQVKETLGHATGLTAEEVSVILNLKQEGRSLKQIREEVGVALDVLNLFMTDHQVTQETIVGPETQIDALGEQSKEPYKINRHLGVSDWPALAHTLGSSDACQTCVTETPEGIQFSIRTTPTATEKTHHKPDSTKTLPQHSVILPTFIYTCMFYTDQLYRTNLLTAEKSCHKAPCYQFKMHCRWNELPGGSLLITGGFEGFQTVVREVVKIDTLRESAVSSQPPMHTARRNHAAVYRSRYLYVLGGYRDRDLGECERYVCAEYRWEVLPALPVACSAMSAVVLDNSLYVLGGNADERDLDTVQKLSLDSLTWELMQLKLPQADNEFPCFKTDTQVYLVIKETLYSFTPLQVKPIKTLPVGTYWCDTSYYSRGMLYYSWCAGSGSLALEELT